MFGLQLARSERARSVEYGCPGNRHVRKTVGVVDRWEAATPMSSPRARLAFVLVLRIAVKPSREIGLPEVQRVLAPRGGNSGARLFPGDQRFSAVMRGKRPPARALGDGPDDEVPALGLLPRSSRTRVLSRTECRGETASVVSSSILRYTPPKPSGPAAKWFRALVRENRPDMNITDSAGRACAPLPRASCTHAQRSSRTRFSCGLRCAALCSSASWE